MRSQTILVVFGTRPEAIKMAPIVQELNHYSERTRTVVCFTGQHRDLVKPILDLFGVTTDIDLQVMQPDQTLSQLTARLLVALDDVMRTVDPHWVLAQGDTTSAMATALTAYYHRASFGHVEAGLRTGNKYHPFPEEGNRIIADQLADMCFAPTSWSRQNLLTQGIPVERILLTGNTIVDALQEIAARPYRSPTVEQFPPDKTLLLVTAHRRENFGQPLRHICLGLRKIAQEHPDILIVYPVHPNPHVQKTVKELLANVPGIHLLPPVDYPDMIALMRRATLVLTDSGGLQEEAPALGVPVFVLRKTTERPEGIEAGVARLVGTDPDEIAGAVHEILQNPQRFSLAENPYGDGRAAKRIVRYLVQGEP